MNRNSEIIAVFAYFKANFPLSALWHEKNRQILAECPKFIYFTRRVVLSRHIIIIKRPEFFTSEKICHTIKHWCHNSVNISRHPSPSSDILGISRFQNLVLLIISPIQILVKEICFTVLPPYKSSIYFFGIFWKSKVR